MSQVRLILVLHNHQPVGNFEGVFEDAYRTSYHPFLDVLENYPEIPFVLHTSGPLLEWLVDRHPEYIARLKAMVEAGRVEILGGGSFEPILTMIPHRDRVGQIREFSNYLQDLFATRVRGMWVPERVWEQHLVSAIVEAGIEYTVLDDFHFERAGCSRDDVFGYYLTEDDGRLLKVFPASETLRYSIPFSEPHATYEFLKRLAEGRPGCTVVFADDGEKFGTWPKTFDHVYTRGWLTRFCDMIRANRDWLEPTTLARAVEEVLPLGKVFLPDGSYREMNEWALPPESLRSFRKGVERLAALPDAGELKRFFRAGGYWRNFKARYPESDEMYARMLGVSQRLAAVRANPNADPDYLEVARQELYRGQCNCPYWHGSFGGLYLPHLRNAIYRALIAAHNALDDALGRDGARVQLEVGDFNLDARQEVRLENEHVIAWVCPARGGHVYELDVRSSATNLLATLDRRPEAYHATILEAAARSALGPNRVRDEAADSDQIAIKQQGLERRLVYDRHPRKALVDHFYPIDVTLEDLIECRDVERGDFAIGTFLAKVHREPDRVALVMERPGLGDGHSIRVRKTIELAAGDPSLSVRYEFEDVPKRACLHFAVEINLAGMAGHALDRYYSDPAGAKLGLLDARLDLLHAGGLTVTDRWLDLSVSLSWSKAASLWCFPIETVSQSEGGFEGVYQSSAVIPHWQVKADEHGRWDVRIRWSLDHAAALNSLPERSSLLTEVLTS
ncbi:MAG: alpha-amylase/4-alpha-glucanotransferase domain-containing protein [Isosphaerales bacterium]